MRAPLMSKSNSFQSNYEELVLRVRSFQKKNDQYQLLLNESIDTTMAQQIIEEKQIMDNEAKETKQLFEKLEENGKEPQYRLKLKSIKKQYETQVSRYRTISESLMERSVIKAEIRDSLKRKTIQDYKSRITTQGRYIPNPRNSNNIIQEQLQLDIDYAHEDHLLKERSNQLKKVEESLEKINDMHKDMAEIVNEQGDMVNIIGDNITKAHENVGLANEQLVEAKKLQEKSRRKWMIIIGVILLVVILGVGGYLLYHFTHDS